MPAPAADHAAALGAALRRAQERIQDALDHFQLAHDTARLEPRLAELVDWPWVARQMALALGWTPEPPEPDAPEDDDAPPA